MKITKAKTIIGSTAIAMTLNSCPGYFHKPQIKVTNTVLKDTFIHKKPMKILILDDFKNNNLDIDCDPFDDIPHGYAINKIIKKGLPNANIENINVPSDAKDFEKVNSGNKSILSKVLKDIKNGKKYDAINISWGDVVSLKSLSEQTKINITQANIASKKQEIKNFLLSHKNETFKDDGNKIGPIANIVNDLDSISAKGTKIYIASGNSGDEDVNLLALTNKAINVGALDLNNRKHTFSANNSLVNRWEQSAVEINTVKGGYNITGGKSVDIPKKYTTSTFHLASILPLEGTSFATPKALVKDMKRTTNK